MRFCKGLHQSTVSPLERVQNAAARVTLGLKELYWLPVTHRIQYKVALLMFMVHDNHCPVYLHESVQPVAATQYVNVFFLSAA